MSDTARNLIQMTVSSVASAGLGTLTLGSAVADHLAFEAGDDGLTFTVTITETGVGQEVNTGCTYTHSGTTLTRGTLEKSTTGSAIAFSSAAIVSVTASADRGRRWDSAALAHVAGPDADTTMAVGNLYVVDGATLTANRTYTLPAVAAVGDRIGVIMSAESSSYEILLTAGSGDTLKGIAGGTEWSRIFQAGETIVMRCISASAAWGVEVDGRIAQVGRMGLTSDITTSSAGAWNATDFTETLIEKGCIVTVSGAATSTIKVRRTGNYIISGAALAKSGAVLADQESHGWACTANGNVGTGTVLCAFSASKTSGTAVQGSTGIVAAPCTAGDLLQHNFYWQTTANAGLRGLNYASFLAVSEVL